ncbi:hypothetical protein ACGFYQ_41885 [Streptomyces sp. NPDC048258]|uniref:hypothetical protein n=1 Tax=Streptomyces sp. NPDC048258 TaxID=3365527 RepID=UPI0037101A30
MAHLLSRNRTKPRPGAPAARLRRIGVLLAGAITAGLLSAAPASADPAPAAPIALASVTATADDQLYALAADHSAVYRWNGEGTDWTKVGGPAQDLYAGGAGLFATSPGTGALNKYNGQPDSWSQIGGAGADFAVTGDHLYGLNPDRTAVYEWSGTGTDWTKIGGPAQDLEAGGAGLFATSPDGKLYKYNGQPETWSEIGGAGADFAVTGDHLYGLNPDRTAVYQWSGHGSEWTRVGGPAQDLYAGGAGLFATNRTDGSILRYDGGRWSGVGSGGSSFTVSGHHLYGLSRDRTAVSAWSGTDATWNSLGAPTAPMPASDTTPAATPPTADSGPASAPPPTAQLSEEAQPAPVLSVTAKDNLYMLRADHSAVWQWSGDGQGWAEIGGPTAAVYAGRVGTFATNPDTGKIYKYQGGREWSEVGEAGAAFAVSGEHLYRLAPDRSAVYEWSGKGTSWTRIGGPARNIYAGGAGLFATNPDTGHVYKYDGQPDNWTKVGGPGATFAVSDDHLYGLSPDKAAVNQWEGQYTYWTPLGGGGDPATGDPGFAVVAALGPQGRDCAQAGSPEEQELCIHPAANVPGTVDDGNVWCSMHQGVFETRFSICSDHVYPVQLRNLRTQVVLGNATIRIQQEINTERDQTSFTEHDIVTVLRSDPSLAGMRLNLEAICAPNCNASAPGPWEGELPAPAGTTLEGTVERHWQRVPGGSQEMNLAWTLTASLPDPSTTTGTTSWGGAKSKIRCDDTFPNRAPGCVVPDFKPTYKIDPKYAQASAFIRAVQKNSPQHVGMLPANNPNLKSVPLHRGDPKKIDDNRGVICPDKGPNVYVKHPATLLFDPQAQCDEYPFAAAEESGAQSGISSGSQCGQYFVSRPTPASPPVLAPDNRVTNNPLVSNCGRASMPKSENGGAGSPLGTFAVSWRLQIGDAYWVDAGKVP